MFESLRAKRPGTSLGKIVFYEICRAALAMAFALIFRVRVYHAPRVPASGAPLLVGASDALAARFRA